ncbi:hypothetical protein DCOP10_12051 [Armatimonadetes bacterium DC]|nr:hypothetical protein DCOP10_12051 [Armatimonadetes bacterium DC]
MLHPTRYVHVPNMPPIASVWGKFRGILVLCDHVSRFFSIVLAVEAQNG